MKEQIEWDMQMLDEIILRGAAEDNPDRDTLAAIRKHLDSYRAALEKAFP